MLSGAFTSRHELVVKALYALPAWATAVEVTALCSEWTMKAPKGSAVTSILGDLIIDQLAEAAWEDKVASKSRGTRKLYQLTPAGVEMARQMGCRRPGEVEEHASH